jgi:hypothetical protein
MSKSNGKQGALVIIGADGTTDRIHFKPGVRPSIETMRAAIGGGYVELFHVEYEGKRREAYADEDGKLKGQPFNAEATRIASPHVIVGTMAVWVP